MTLKRSVASVLILAGAVFVLYWYFPVPPASQGQGIMPTDTLILAGTSVRVAIADTEALREHGLSGYSGLAPDEGMLFVFPSDGTYSFWMKDMLFSIDMLWIDAQGRVVDIEKAVSPDTFPQAFTPDSPSRYVLEVSAGFSDKHTIVVGSKVEW